MAILDIIDAVLNPLLGWMFDIPSFATIVILSVSLGLINTLLQKYMTDQEKMRRLKDDTKKLQKQMKKLQKDGKHEKAMDLQQKLLPIQMQLMKESFRPLLVTMLPFIMIFFWLANHFAYLPVTPGEPFDVTAVFEDGVSGEVTLSVPEQMSVDESVKKIENGRAVWTVAGEEGRHRMSLTYAGAEFSRDVLITNERAYERPDESLSGPVREFNIGNQKLLPLGDGFNLFGWYPGWIFYYILISIPVSLGLKKVLNVV